METAAFDYELPEQAIAQVPIEPRDRARLLVDGGPTALPEHCRITDLPALVGPGDVLVVNTTRVLPARLHLRKPTGGAVEVLLLERTPGGWDALVRPSRRVARGTVLVAGDDLAVAFGGDGTHDGTREVTLQVPPDADEIAVLGRHGVVPLPPYITTPLADPERYQTVFADRPLVDTDSASCAAASRRTTYRSVAAPTAGLHLTPDLLDRCRGAGAQIVPVELAVGLGTFRPMQSDKVEDHQMHAEGYRVPAATVAACHAATRVVAVGTTAARALESAASTGQLEGRTELFIHCPYHWQVVDALLTNFHLPCSSLLVMIDAFVGPRWRVLYETALAEGYRFLSFGDAMFLERSTA